MKKEVTNVLWGQKALRCNYLLATEVFALL